MNIGNAMEPSMAMGLEPKKRVIGAWTITAQHTKPTCLGEVSRGSGGVRRDRIPVNLRQELREDGDEEHAANDGILMPQCAPICPTVPQCASHAP